MAISTYVPLMKEGHTLRNIGLALMYLVAFPLTILILPFWGVATVALNRHGAADALSESALSRLPGISSSRWLSSAATFSYLVLIVFVIIVGIGALAPASDDPAGSSTVAPETTTTVVEQTTEIQTTVVTTTAAVTTTPTSTPTTTTTTSTPTPTPTPTSTTTTAIPTTTETATTTASGPENAWTVSVLEVTDGDTMDVRMPDGSRETIRLLGVDTPETSEGNTDPAEWEGIPTSDSGRNWLADWGGRASSYAKERLAGQEIYIEVDEESDRRGSYGRLLVYAYQSESSSKSFNLRLIENGYSRMYDSQFSKRAEFQSAESTAQSSDIGVWDYSQQTTTTTTSTGGGQSSNIVVWNVHADANGNDHENLDDEYITLKNTGDASVDMGGWSLSDSADHSYTFPSGFTLGAGQTVTIYTGSGSNSGSSLFWGSDSAVWNNGGDTIIVMSDSGETVIKHEY